MVNLKDIKLFLLDQDGTLYLSDKPIMGAAAAVKRMRQAGAGVCFLTNNSSKSSANYLAKLTRLGFEPKQEEIYTSSLATIEYLKQHYPRKKVYLLGTKALEIEFLHHGIKVVQKSPDIVVAGYDTELTYQKLCDACVHISRGAGYIATHPDLTCPAEGGLFLPDTGSFIALINAATGRLPEAVCGKPNAPMADGIKRHFGFEAPQIAMVGDRLSTDMQFAKDFGFVSILVLSGETTEKMLKKSDIKPDLVLNSVAELRI